MARVQATTTTSAADSPKLQLLANWAKAEKAELARARTVWSWACDGAVTMDDAMEATDRRLGLACGAEAGACMGDLRLTAPVGKRKEALRQRAAGRSGCSSLKTLGKRAIGALRDARRTPTVLHAALIANWRLGEAAAGQDFIICDFRVAVKKRRKLLRKLHPEWQRAQVDERLRSERLTVAERDSLGLVVRPRGRKRLATILASAGGANAWLGGPAAGAGCYLTGTLKALWMGMSIRSGSVVRARRLLGEEGLAELVGDSIYEPFATSLVEFGDEWAQQEQGVRTYGSLFSGGFDAFAQSIRRVHGAVDVGFVAEIRPERRQLLRWEYAPKAVFSTASAAALMATPQGTVAWSAPCVDVSKARVVTREERPQAVLRAKENMLEAAEDLVEYAVRCLPIVILGEQAGGLVSHYREVHEALTDRLLQLPYAWWLGVVDTAAIFKAPCNRVRVGIVGVRLDKLVRPVPRRCVGAWWLEGGDCSGCGARRADGRCILAECEDAMGAAEVEVEVEAGREECGGL